MGRKLQNIPLRYSRIDFKARVQLIQSVLAEGKSISQASKKLGIKFSTAKMIVKRYKQSGYILTRKEGQEAGTQIRDQTAQVSLENKQQNEVSKNPENEAIRRMENSQTSFSLFWPCYYAYASKMVYFVGWCTIS